MNQDPSAETHAPAEERRRVLLLVAYDGASFSGFQQQANAPSIAGELDRAIHIIDPGASRVVGSSRTDAGVHARLQPVAFFTTKRIASRNWVLALTQHLPRSIAVLRAASVSSDFDPRKRPLWKRYRYCLRLSQVEDPFLAERSWRVGQPLDVPLMQKEARALVGEHDFAAFRSSSDARTTTVRRLHDVRVAFDPSDPCVLSVEVQGDRFLYNMVRIIVGTLVDVGRGRIQPGAVARALASKSRLDLGMTAPAAGLCLDHVELDSWGEEAWPSDADAALSKNFPRAVE